MNRDHFTRPTPQPHQWHHKHRDMPWAQDRPPLLIWTRMGAQAVVLSIAVGAFVCLFMAMQP